MILDDWNNFGYLLQRNYLLQKNAWGISWEENFQSLLTLQEFTNIQCENDLSRYNTAVESIDANMLARVGQ